MARIDRAVDVSSKIPIMLRINAMSSTPILIDASATYDELLDAISKEVYARAPNITEGFSFDGIYIEWDRSSGMAMPFPQSSALDRNNLAATLALLKTRVGGDVLCIKVRVSGPNTRLHFA